MGGRVGAVYGVWKAPVWRCWSVVAAVLTPWAVCVLLVRALCVGSLSYNNLGEEGGKAIAAALQHTPNMQQLG